MVQLNMSKSQQMKNNKKEKKIKIKIQKDSIYLLYQLVEKLKG